MRERMITRSGTLVHRSRSRRVTRAYPSQLHAIRVVRASLRVVVNTTLVVNTTDTKTKLKAAVNCELFVRELIPKQTPPRLFSALRAITSHFPAGPVHTHQIKPEPPKVSTYNRWECFPRCRYRLFCQENLGERI